MVFFLLHSKVICHFLGIVCNSISLRIEHKLECNEQLVGNCDSCSSLNIRT